VNSLVDSNASFRSRPETVEEEAAHDISQEILRAAMRHI
jgi:hypothetical protein